MVGAISDAQRSALRRDRGSGAMRCAYCALLHWTEYRFFAIPHSMLRVVETLNAAVDAEIEALPKDMRARLSRLTSVIEQVGFIDLPRDSVKHLEDKLWELRITGRFELNTPEVRHEIETILDTSLEDGELILARRLNRTGRRKLFTRRCTLTSTRRS